jgi:hypothetical protein
MELIIWSGNSLKSAKMMGEEHENKKHLKNIFYDQ